MKKRVLLIIECIISIVVLAQKPFSVYDWKGHVQLKEDKEQQWKPVHKGQLVSGLDSVDIEKNGMLRVIDKRINLIYKSTSTGKICIYTLINDAKKQKSRTLSAVNKELLSGANNTSKTPTMQVAGATTRSGGNGHDYDDDIASTFRWLGLMALNDELKNDSPDFLMKGHKTSKGTYFEIRNLSNKGYFVNVIHLNKKSKEMSLCYIIEQNIEHDAPYIFLPKGEVIQIKDLLFNINDDDVYILVGTEDKYIPEQIQDSLHYQKLESAQPLYQRYKYFKF